VVSNQRLHNIFGDLPARQAFRKADNIVAAAVKGVAEIITIHGNINIDYTDVFTVMHNSSVFIMGTGIASGEGRAMNAVNQALESPLLDSNDIYGTQNILLNIISGKDEITIGEIGEIIEVLQERAGQDADIIWGNGYDESLGEDISVTILATGFVTNPNQLLQPKKEPEKYNLEAEEAEQADENQEPVEVEADSGEEQYFLKDDTAENNRSEKSVSEKKSTIKTITDKPLFSTKRKKKKKKKEKADEPVGQNNIDNWFYKNFGLGKLFEDEEQSLEE